MQSLFLIKLKYNHFPARKIFKLKTPSLQVPPSPIGKRDLIVWFIGGGCTVESVPYYNSRTPFQFHCVHCGSNTNTGVFLPGKTEVKRIKILYNVVPRYCNDNNNSFCSKQLTLFYKKSKLPGWFPILVWPPTYLYVSGLAHSGMVCWEISEVYIDGHPCIPSASGHHSEPSIVHGCLRVIAKTLQ